MSANAPGLGTDVFIPWRDHPSRRAALAHVSQWWHDHGFTVHTVDAGYEPFNLAACRNEAMRRASSHVVILADADTLPEVGPLMHAMALASDELGTVLPYTEYRSLRALGSRQAYAGAPLADCAHMVVPDACSGIYVTTRAAWARHHGQDELFRGWGCEDAAWWITHTALVGPPRRIAGSVYALTHDSQDKDGEPTRDNYARIYLYEQATGDPVRIAALATGGA
jgi:hypothetical protein